MRLILDVVQMRACMALWRETVALAQRPRSNAQLQLNDREALARATATATGWSDLLGLCRADEGEEPALQELRLEVLRFKDWIADAALAANVVRYAEQLENDKVRSKRSGHP